MESRKKNFYIDVLDDEKNYTQIRLHYDKGRLYFDENITIDLLTGGLVFIVDAQYDQIKRVEREEKRLL
tara:strand:+ start:391 stop:597 length:207 start_codon:yes stop_codon:yes gene_type:complete